MSDPTMTSPSTRSAATPQKSRWAAPLFAALAVAIVAAAVALLALHPRQESPQPAMGHDVDDDSHRSAGGRGH